MSRRIGEYESGISIHAPREGCDCVLCDPYPAMPTFQSTHPVRGATPYRDGTERAIRISIHAPREGCDWARTCKRLKPA